MFQVNLLFVVFALTYGNRINVTENQVYWDGKIVGGRNVAIEDYPYQLSFEYGGNHWCGAALIKPNVGITAAHCTEPIGVYLDFLSVRAGTAIKQQGGQVAKIVKICEHPKYDSEKSYDYDIAVMLLDKSLIINNAVQTVLLQPVGAEVKVGTLGSISGWGLLSEDGEFPTNLQAVDVPKVDDAVCKTAYPSDVITSRMCCYGYKDGGKDACKGDSGGPLVVNGKLEGIVSWGHGCATAKNPGIYCKISHPEIRSFIEECIKKF